MKKIYALSQGSYSDYSVLAVVHDKAQAEEWMNTMNNSEAFKYEEVFIEEAILLEPGDKPEIVTTYRKLAELWDDGRIIERELIVTRGFPICYPYSPPNRPTVEYIRAPYHHDKGGRIDIAGRTEESVMKVFSEKVAAWRAGQFGGPNYVGPEGI